MLQLKCFCSKMLRRFLTQVRYVGCFTASKALSQGRFTHTWPSFTQMFQLKCFYCKMLGRFLNEVRYVECYTTLKELLQDRFTNTWPCVMQQTTITSYSHSIWFQCSNEGLHFLGIFLENWWYNGHRARICSFRLDSACRSSLTTGIKLFSFLGLL